MIRLLLFVPFLIACGTEPESVAEAPVGGCITFANPTGGPGQICGSFADTFRYYATGGNPGAYTDASFTQGLALFGWPIAGPETRDGDVWMTFERVEMNQNGNGCGRGACISLSGSLDLKATGYPFVEGWTDNCWEDNFKARPLACLDQFNLPNLSFVTTRIGGDALRLEYYGFPVSAPRNCDWWDQRLVGSRQCVYTQRAKLGYFPENQPLYQWQGEQLGLKAKRRRDGATFDVLAYMQNTHGGRLRGNDNSIVSYFAVPGRFYYVKGSANNNTGRVFERYGYDGHDVWLERDTSWPDGGPSYHAYDCVDPDTHRYGKGSLVWGKRVESDGDQFDFKTQVIGLTDACQWSNGQHNSTFSGTKGVRHQALAVGGSIGTVDAIALDYGPCETHWYGLGWGWIRWEYHDSTICTHRPGPDITWNDWSSNSVTPVESCGDAPVAFGGP